MHRCIHLLLYYAYRSIHYGSKVIILIDSIILLHDSLWSKTYHIQVCGLMNGHNQIRYKIQISVCVDEFTYLLHTKA